MARLTKLFTPIRIGSMELANRLVMSPMTTGYATQDLLPSPQLLEYLEARARGGVGLITLEACTIDRRHREVPRSMHFSSDAVIGAHRELTDRIHSHGVKVQPQLVHPGPDGLAPFLEKIPSLGPSVIPSYLTGVPSRELETDEIDRIVEQYGDAARRVREAGYDGIELHAAHGYMLIGSFLSPWRNKRGDAYSGDTAEGRTRLLLEVLGAIKGAAGHDFPVTLRISGYEGVPGGRALSDTQRMAPRLVEAGVDAFHVSGGVIDRLTSQIVTGSHYPDGHNVPAAAALKLVVEVPVMVVGRIHDPRLAERILERGSADLIAMGRPLLADPQLPNKARRARFAAIRRCISCQNCIDSMETASLSCAVNGLSGRESELRVTPVPRARRVVVVGGGPAGLEAARIAALRGHRVVLLEKQRTLGGALLLAATVHPENQPLLDFLLAEVRRLGIDVRPGEEATPDGIRALHPEVVIVATGGRVVPPAIPGDDAPHVRTGTQLREMLAGAPPAAGARTGSTWQRLAVQTLGGPLRRFVTPTGLRALTRLWMPLGERVAIVGADLAAVELAEFLADRGRRVFLLERGEEIAPEVGLKRRTEHMDRLDRLGVSVNTGVEYRRITLGGIEIGSKGGKEKRVEADSVVLAGTLEPELGLFRAIEGTVSEAYAIGDCTGLGLLRKATEEATRVACGI
jgi:2,4-dienoyl-CoA reductase (NADPH2)